MTNRKYAVLTDSACDMPYDLEKATGVEIFSFDITVDGKSYAERIDFDFDEYYDILRNCERVPSTAHITMPRFLEKFEEKAREGCEDVLCVTINSTGSATYDAALLAKKEFLAANPASQMNIYIVDSHCYSMGYGRYVAEAAQRLEAGEAMADIVPWLEERLSRLEIILGAFSLKFMKKSGRISAAAAFAGELLGLRPIISLNDGVSVVRKKVRSDKEVLPALMDYAENHSDGGMDYCVGGTSQAVVEELAEMCTQKWGAPPKHLFKLGAAVATNTGPDAIAITYTGPARPRPVPGI